MQQKKNYVICTLRKPVRFLDLSPYSNEIKHINKVFQANLALLESGKHIAKGLIIN